MLRLLKRTLLALALAGAVNSASAFSLLGLYDTWQVAGIGYNIGLAGFIELGGPMNLGEEYRWNVPTLYYAFDSAFLNYFGQKGVDEITKAITILNNLPAVSQMSANLAEFPNDTRRANYQASALGLLDLKSYTLGILINQLGVASPERWVWALRQRIPITGGFQYQVIKRNFDPVTYNPSSYVNGTLYTYMIGDPVLTAPDPQFADAVEMPVDPLAFTYTAVASTVNSYLVGSLSIGDFFTGLTRDDVGALRYSYRANNYNVEGLATSVSSNATVFSDPWTPIGGTNTNTVVVTALRPGIEKMTFVRVQYDSVFGTFITFTNNYTDAYVTNSSLKTQTLGRVITAPDIIFSAADLAGATSGFTIPAFVNNAALQNSANTLAGPGIIQGPVVITYNKVGPYNVNSSPSSLDEASASQSFLWGAFDGTTDAPFIWPDYITVQDLEQQVLGGR